MRRLNKATIGSLFVVLLLAIGTVLFIAGDSYRLWKLQTREPSWLPDNRARDEACETRLILDRMRIRPGEVVVDVGAGAGYFTFKIARLVGSRGLVIATCDKNAMAVIGLEYIRRHAEIHHLHNVVTKFVELDDPGIDVVADKVLMVNLFSFHDMQSTRAYFRKLHGILPPGGEVFVFQSDSKHSRDGGWDGYVMPEGEMILALKGFFAVEWRWRGDKVCPKSRSDGYFLIFKKI